MAHHLQRVKPKEQAENAIKRILAKLEAGNYKNAQYEESDRKMLEIYLKRVV